MTKKVDSPMPLTVAVQMDPLAGINIAGDSSFALMLSAQARGHRLFHYAAEDLNWSDGRLWARAHPVEVRRVEGDHFTAGEPVKLDLGRDADGGTLLVAWFVEQDARLGWTLSVEWQETGLVPASRRRSSAREGYGRELIERALPYQLGAETSYALGDTELRCTIRVPIVSEPAGMGEE